MSTNRMDKKQIGNHERKDSIPSIFNIKKNYDRMVIKYFLYFNIYIILKSFVAKLSVSLIMIPGNISSLFNT